MVSTSLVFLKIPIITCVFIFDTNYRALSIIPGVIDSDNVAQ